jgi:hypothetical protein
MSIAASYQFFMLNRPGFSGGHWYKLCRHGRSFQHGVIALLGFGRRYVADGSRSLRLLNQSSYSSVANSTASKLRHGPRRWITSPFLAP